ncbi:MAG: sigma 54-interacting transcriptional regulator [Bacteriovoracales bacterium]|nr:sigma 54-interacting transcriptional regulator [Bacteriovoracales bacterium]
MINWKEIAKLHAIQKLEKIIGNWFGVEFFFTDDHLNVQGNILNKGYDFHNDFAKIQLNLDFGKQYLKQDIEKAFQELQSGNNDKDQLKKAMYYDSFFSGIRGIAAPIIIQGELKGAVLAAPYVPSSFSVDEADAVVKRLVECGAKHEDAKIALEGLARLTLEDKNRLAELIELVAEEVATFHLEITVREERILELNNELGSKYRFHNLIGKSKKMQVLYHLLEKIQKSESTVLIQGDNGTGKELVAKAIHYQSPRKDRVFVAQNCSAFNDNLLDSELFGHVKGAFTGAIKDKKGLFETANGGTLFLDEVGDTSMAMQVKLLRVLQEGTFLPVGATQPRKVDVRVITATNRPLREMIEKGEFREDLYYRINVINVALPPLRERHEDVALLSEYFLEQRCGELGTPTKSLSKRTLEKMLNYSWPGNVRELENEIERLVVLAEGERVIMPELLSARITDGEKGLFSPPGGIHSTQGTLKKALQELEIVMIREGLERCDFNKSRLAKELGISRAGLIMKVDKYGLDKKKLAS